MANRVEPRRPTDAVADKQRRVWATKGKFKLLEQDCGVFTAAVARSIGLTFPDRSTFPLPQAFIRELAKINR